MSRSEQLRRHAIDCEDCRREPLPLDEVAELLQTSRFDLDVTTMSQQVLVTARVALRQLELRRFWRQVAAVIVVALIPLPLILLYDAFLLRLLHVATASLLSTAVANYIVFTYAASLLFLLAASYAAIPLFMARTMLPRLSIQG